jgi:exopolyphosphatase/pppGpp-phosphohydrolase
MQANSISGPIRTSDFNHLINNYISIGNSTLIQEYKIPEDRIDIIPEALNLYCVIIEELSADIIENSFWSISDGMVRKILKDQL